MARVEAQVPCPKCGKKFPLPLDQMASGAVTACPHCGQTISFRGADLSQVQHALDLLGGQGANVKVNVTVKKKS